MALTAAARAELQIAGELGSCPAGLAGVLAVSQQQQQEPQCVVANVFCGIT
jgi:hypothetical protein